MQNAIFKTRHIVRVLNNFLRHVGMLIIYRVKYDMLHIGLCHKAHYKEKIVYRVTAKVMHGIVEFDKSIPQMRNNRWASAGKIYQICFLGDIQNHYLYLKFKMLSEMIITKIYITRLRFKMSFPVPKQVYLHPIACRVSSPVSVRTLMSALS